MELTALVTQVDSVGAADLQVLTMWAVVSDLTKSISRTSTACSLSRIWALKRCIFQAAPCLFAARYSLLICKSTMQLRVYFTRLSQNAASLSSARRLYAAGAFQFSDVYLGTDGTRVAATHTSPWTCDGPRHRLCIPFLILRTIFAIAYYHTVYTQGLLRAVRSTFCW